MRISLSAGILFLLLLTACESKQAIEKTAPRPSDSTAPYLLVESHDPLHNSKSGEIKREIDDLAEITELMKQIQGLEKFPDTFISCPNDNGISYDLNFMNIYDDAAVNVRATGCKQVTYDNEVLWAIKPIGNAFVSDLVKFLGISESEFSGL